MVSISMRSNNISSLPRWGFAIVSLDHQATAIRDEEPLCGMLVGGTPSHPNTPLHAPRLQRVDLSMNPLKVAARDLLHFLVSADSLTELKCSTCELHGTVDHTDSHIRHRIRFLDKKECKVDRDVAFRKLLRVDLSNNTNMEKCDVVEVREVLAEERDSSGHWKVRCTNCADYMQPRGLPPVPGREECKCLRHFPGMLDYLGDPDTRCGCPEGRYMDVVAKRCEPCLAGMRCNWTAQSREESRRPPVIEPGFWAEPADAEHFVGYTLHRCNNGTCVNNGTCAPGRMGRACGECKPGFWGSRDGSCTRCPVEPTQYRIILAIVFLLGTFCFLVAGEVLLGEGEAQFIIPKDVVSLGRSLKQAYCVILI